MRSSRGAHEAHPEAIGELGEDHERSGVIPEVRGPWRYLSCLRRSLRLFSARRAISLVRTFSGSGAGGGRSASSARGRSMPACLRNSSERSMATSGQPSTDPSGALTHSTSPTSGVLTMTSPRSPRRALKPSGKVADRTVSAGRVSRNAEASLR